MSSEVVIVGAGVIGSSIAYHLAQAGASVALVDQFGPAFAPAASWASAGGLRAQGRNAAERPLAIRAAVRWRELAAELDADLEVGLGGHLHIAEDERQAEAVRRRVDEDAAGGLAIELLDAAGIRRLAPGITDRAMLAAYTPGDGQAHAGRTAAAFARAAARFGAVTRFGSPAEPVLRDGCVEGIRLSNGETVQGELTVLAAGAWSVRLLDGIGLRLPLRWRGLQMLLSDVAAPGLAPTLTAVGRNLSLKQSASGQFMVGGRWFGTMEDGVVGTRPIDAHIARQWDAAAAIYPAVGRLRIAQSWAGAEAQSIDSLPVIGRAPIAGLYLATGFSNHGFQISPEIGALVCNDIVAGEAPLLAPFRPDRATGTTADQVRAFRHEPIDI